MTKEEIENKSVYPVWDPIKEVWTGGLTFREDLIGQAPPCPTIQMANDLKGFSVEGIERVVIDWPFRWADAVIERLAAESAQADKSEGEK